MAQFSMNGVSELADQLSRLGAQAGAIAQEMLNEAAPLLKDEVMKQTEPHRETGDMYRSIKSTRATKADGKGNYQVVVRPTGTDHKGVRNMEKMVYLEYGVRGRAATPVITTAVLNAEAPVIAKMREVFEREVGGME